MNIEGYFKYVFDRTYTSLDVQSQGAELVYRFDGEGRIWGIDVLLQKTESRYWDSYSFTHARYRDPQGVVSNKTIIGSEVVGTAWYYPSFHRFHTVNLVVTIKPLRQFHPPGWASPLGSRRRSWDLSPVSRYKKTLAIEFLFIILV
ncbi:MAG: hypothetical protein LBT13_03765 [Treponema sp.]|nr:hypothetical protein [Treponema sp.]